MVGVISEPLRLYAIMTRFWAHGQGGSHGVPEIDWRAKCAPANGIGDGGSRWGWLEMPDCCVWMWWNVDWYSEFWNFENLFEPNTPPSLNVGTRGVPGPNQVDHLCSHHPTSPACHRVMARHLHKCTGTPGACRKSHANFTWHAPCKTMQDKSWHDVCMSAGLTRRARTRSKLRAKNSCTGPLDGTSGRD